MAQTNASGTRSTAATGAALNDTTVNPTTTGQAAYPSVYNGSSWDRVREATTAAVANPTGIPAVGLVGYNADATGTWRGILADANGGLVTVPQHTTVTTWSVAATSDGTSIDMGYMQMVTVQVLTLTSGGSVEFQGSNNGSTFFPVNLYSVGTSVVHGASTTLSQQGASHGSRAYKAGVFFGPATFKYFRLSTAHSSGTVSSGNYVLSAAAIAPPTNVGSDRGGFARLGITATAQQLGQNPCRSMTMKASRNNTAVCYIGITTADNASATAPTSTTGFELWPGETLSIDIGNTNQVRCIGTSGDNLQYIWIG